MFFPQIVNVNSDELGFLFKNGKLRKVLSEGTHVVNIWGRGTHYEQFSLREPAVISANFDLLFESPLVDKYVERVEVLDKEYALLWVDKCFNQILSKGKHLFFKTFRNISVEKVSSDKSIFEHKSLQTILKDPRVYINLDQQDIPEGSVGVWYNEGEFIKELPSGRFAFWKESGRNCVHIIDKREKVLDIQGQDILTADRVTVRLNVAVALQVVDARKQVEMVEDAQQMIYREIQLALREMVGQQKLDEMLVSKETLAADIFAKVVNRCTHFGVQINRVGVRDVILPGEMKELLNRVVEAQKSAEANLISRREETAAMRSQMNTAKMIENNPTLMRLKEMEVLERIAEKSQLQILVGEKSVTEQVMKLV